MKKYVDEKRKLKLLKQYEDEFWALRGDKNSRMRVRLRVLSMYIAVCSCITIILSIVAFFICFFGGDLSVRNFIDWMFALSSFFAAPAFLAGFWELLFPVVIRFDDYAVWYGYASLVIFVLLQKWTQDNTLSAIITFIIIFLFHKQFYMKYMTSMHNELSSIENEIIKLKEELGISLDE